MSVGQSETSADYRRGWDAGWKAAREANRPCTCREFCGDTPEDEGGVCKGLRRAPEPPLVEFVVVHRDDLRRAG